MKVKKSGKFFKNSASSKRGKGQKAFRSNKNKSVKGEAYKNGREKNSKKYFKNGHGNASTKKNFSKRKDIKKNYNKTESSEERNESVQRWEFRKEQNGNIKGKKVNEGSKHNKWNIKGRKTWSKQIEKLEKEEKEKTDESENETHKYQKYSWLFENANQEALTECDSEESEHDSKREKKKFVLYKKKKNDSLNMKTSKKDGISLSTFKNLGLSENMCKSISRNLKYNKPTEIQKVCIPHILRGKDVICISKTNSGKSLVYLSTLIDKLKEHNIYFGIRGIIILPTKELAVQIYKLAKKICRKFFNLNINIIIGGVSVVSQFELLKENIDILICCPGRFSHILEETKLSLEKVEMLIIDEADRLFELNYYNEMNIIYKYLNKANKQTLLISATLPTQVENYFKLKLVNAEICHVSSDTVISDQLKLQFIFCRSYETYAILIKLILLFKKKKLGKTIIFFFTKYHILFFSKILHMLRIRHAVLYGNADTDFRMEQIRSFTDNPKIQFFLVTDLAARGINITTVQNVINYNLPASSKLFIHRVGRACRDGQNGYAISIVTYKDIMYAYEIAFFIGKNLCFRGRNGETATEEALINEEVNKQLEEKTEKMEQLFNDGSDEAGCGDEENGNKTRSGSENNHETREENEAQQNDDAQISDNTQKSDKTQRSDKDTIYIGSIGSVNEFLNFIENVKKTDEELISLTKSITSSYKIYYKMRPKVSAYISKKCIDEINKAGGLYKLAMLHHPDELYTEMLNEEKDRNCQLLSMNNKYEKQDKEKKTAENASEIDGIFMKLTSLLKIKEHGKPSKKMEEETNHEIEKEKINDEEKGITNIYTKEETNLENNKCVTKKENGTNYSQEGIVSFLHDFQKKDENKTKIISDELREKLNKLKKKKQFM